MLGNNLSHFAAGNESYDVLFLSEFVPAGEKISRIPC